MYSTWSKSSCNVQAKALDAGDGLTSAMKTFYDDRNHLMYMSGVTEYNTKKRAKHVEDVE